VLNELVNEDNIVDVLEEEVIVKTQIILVGKEEIKFNIFYFTSLHHRKAGQTKRLRFYAS